MTHDQAEPSAIRSTNVKLSELRERIIAAGLLILLMLVGFCFWHSVQVARSQWIYYSTRYGQDSGSMGVEAMSGQAVRAGEFYPYNHYFATLVAETAYRQRQLGAQAPDPMIELATQWCDQGLGLNPYRRALRLQKARLLELTSAKQAADYWCEYVEWHFWDPRNLALGVEFCIKAGDRPRALEFLALLKDTEFYPAAKRWTDRPTPVTRPAFRLK